MNSSFSERGADITTMRDRRNNQRSTLLASFTESFKEIRIKKNLVLLAVVAAALYLSWIPVDTRRRITTKGSISGRRNITMSFKLPSSAVDWCAEPKLPPFDYYQCEDKSTINRIPLYGGLTNSLKLLLLGAILSFEEDRCFVVDESTSALAKRDNPEHRFNSSFYERYFSPVGLLDASQTNSKPSSAVLRTRDWKETWGNWTHNRRIKSKLNTIDSLGVKGVDGHLLKRYILRRLWRPLPWIRENVCTELEDQLSRNTASRSGSSRDDFIAFSVRRGDKVQENFTFATLDQYIVAAEKAAVKHFHGGRDEKDIYNNPKKMPTIFVATDDCTVMRDFRSRRPNWNFVTACDDTTNHQSKDGFRANDMTRWDPEATDAHFQKFMLELFAMASAKYFIGVLYTNVTWWVLFMRSQDQSTFQILKTPGTENREGIDYW